MKILKVIDMWGWAYDFVNREYARYSRHQVESLPFAEVEIEPGKWDVIYIHGTDICEACRLKFPIEAKQAGIPVVGGYGGYKEEVYSYCDAICCIAPQSVEWSKRKYACPIHFITEGIDTEYWKPDTGRDYARPIVVGWAGRIVPLKRTHLLDRLIRPVLVQSDHEPEHFRRGRQLDPMQAFYKKIDVLVILSSTECMPRVLMEAMACGLPVISTDVGNVSAVLPDEWLIKEVSDAGIVERANQLLVALEDARVREMTGIENRETIIEKSSWEVLAPKWDDMFEEVVARCQPDFCTS